MSQSEQKFEKKTQDEGGFLFDEDRFVNTTIPSTLFKVKAEDMVRFSKSIGCNLPKYTLIPEDKHGQPDPSKLRAHPMFPSLFTIKPLFLLEHMKDTKTDTMIIKDKRKFLHATHRFNYENTIPIKHGQILSTKGKLVNMFLKNEQLWCDVELTTHTLKKELVVRTFATFIMRKGGFVI